jgi:DNA polymerase-4
MVQSDGPPNAVQVVPPGKEREFLAPLPAEALWGVGPVTASRLAELGIFTIGDIAHRNEGELERLFGKHGRDLARRARGIDHRLIVTSREAKSISREVTFARDIRDESKLRDTLQRLSNSVAKRLRRANLAASTVKIKIRWPDFTTLTRQLTLAEPTDQSSEIFTAAEDLLRRVWDSGHPVRLLGVGVSGLKSPTQQLSLWDPPPDDASQAALDKEKQLKSAIDGLRARYGDKVVWWGDQEESPDG